MNYSLQTIWIKAVVSLTDVNTKIKRTEFLPQHPTVSQASEALSPNVIVYYTYKCYFSVSCFSFCLATDTLQVQWVVLKQNEANNKKSHTHAHARTHQLRSLETRFHS
jgi:hypothetical protein